MCCALTVLRASASRRAAVAVLTAKPAATSSGSVICLGFMFLPKSSEARLILQLNEFLVAETRLVDSHVQRKALGGAVASEAEIATIVRLVETRVHLDG